ncbi:hypothetical protein PARMER_00339 [Parabacteroides merdae ATCC 43184]|nr:hypothetical protein PARMER_00339 [Parabacteroides merdae ATCC 43184]
MRSNGQKNGIYFFHSVNVFLKQYDLQQLNKQCIPHNSSSVPKQKKT